MHAAPSNWRQIDRSGTGRSFSYMASLTDNYFALFDLPQRFAVDMQALEQAYRTVQTQVHPDRFAQASDAEKRLAMQWATQANLAYQTLRQPLKRAAYLCALAGVDLQTESNTAMPAAFLMQQMEWREGLDEACAQHSSRALDSLLKEVTIAQQTELAQIAHWLDQEGNASAAGQSVRKLMFLDKFAAEVEDAYERL